MDALGISRIGADYDHLAELGQYPAGQAPHGLSAWLGATTANSLEIGRCPGLTALLMATRFRAIGQAVAGVLDIDARVHFATLQ